jgi:two-component system response regulator MprA
VLVVDDDETLAGLLVEMLTLEGLEVRARYSAEAALAELGGWRPQVILLDLMMPQVSGWALRQQLKDEPAFADIPVVVVSAVPPDRFSNSLEPIAGWVPKPFSMFDLLDTIREVTTRAARAASQPPQPTA